ncbi:hypothetical protein [Vulgatibacter incomptus]|uniref:Lipoprotein n=1 Tax=Vulgatibacter incomptus TaxID=1391653 RepID=A0A0K1P8D5_9BACT|nr:hypothetical protein [Vulgatibacter incomptus]AKU89757.1 hypothetical protein AKJ08_0144 [Vulgatibacter incomptus]
MLKSRLALIPIAVLALSSCGSESKKQIGPGTGDPDMENPAAYFGVEACQCYEYESPGSAFKLGVAVERVNNQYSPDHKDMNVVVYRQNGTTILSYVVDPTEPDLLLHRVFSGEGGQDEWRLEPGLPLFRWPMQKAFRTSDTDAHAFQNGVEQEDLAEKLDYSVIYTKEQVVASRTGSETETFDAIKVDYFGTPWDEQSRWFVPKVGVVKLELGNSANRSTWTLKKIRTLKDCPSVNPKDACGL